MAKKNYAAICNSIIAVCGGENNISRISHCMTRLRVQLLDGSKLNREEAGKIPGVLNLVVQNGEYQFVIGQDVPNLYAEFIKHEGLKTGGEVTDAAALKQDTEAKKGNVMNTIMSFIGGTFSPVIPVLIAGGLTGAVLTLLTAFFGVSTESGTYTVIYAINQATFYFLPIFIGFPIQQVSYNSTVFPVILGVLFMAVVYRFLSKVVPVYLRTIFVPLITMLITVPVTLIVLGPIGNLMGTWLANGVFAIYRAAPPVAVMIIGITTPLMVFFGMNNATYPIVFALLAEVGSDPLICTGMAPANVAVGGACLAAALIAKDINDRSVATGAGITALCGITEPGVYGVLFTKKYPLIGAMVGGGLGGLLAGLVGMTQYVISTPGFISIPAYINPDGTSANLIWAMVVMVLAVTVAFGVTYVLGKKMEK